jgi:hypothetical protein
MKKPDLSKLKYVSGLSRLAGMFIENADYENAEKMAEQIAKCDYPVLSSEIFIKTGNIRKVKGDTCSPCRGALLCWGSHKSSRMLQEFRNASRISH